MKKVLGFIPAAGHGKRMMGELLIKELLPIFIPERKAPLLLFENSLITMKQAGINDVVCTINESKTDLMKYMNLFSSKQRMSIAYVHQDVNNGEYGLPYAIEKASPFLYNHTVVMRFPDTIIMPEDCVQTLLEYHYKNNSSLTLGVFDTDHPKRLAPIDISEQGKILEIQDKPEKPCAKNTWNCVIWEDSFLDVVKDMVKHSRTTEGKKEELLLYDVFHWCLQHNMSMYGMKILNGVCIDISSCKDFIKLWEDTRL